MYRILKLSLNKESLLKLLSKGIDETLFDEGSSQRELFSVVKSFFRSYGDIPTEQEIERRVSPHQREAVKELLKVLSGVEIVGNVDAIIDEFIDERRAWLLRSGIQKASEYWEKGNYKRVIEVFRDVSARAESLGKDFAEHSIKDYRPSAKQVKRVRLGFPSIDKATNGLEEGQFMVVMGFPKSGKSTFLLNAALNAFNKGYKVLFVSIEIPRDSIQRRLLSCATEIPYSVLKSGELTPEQQAKVEQQYETWKAQKGELIVLDAPKCTPPFLALKMSERDWDLVVIDYLNLVSLERSFRDEPWLVLGDVTRELRETARKLRVPILTAVQVNREALKYAKGVPGVEFIAQSFLIVYHADIIVSLMLENPEELELCGSSLVKGEIVATRDCPHVSFTLDARFTIMSMSEVPRT